VADAAVVVEIEADNAPVASLVDAVVSVDVADTVLEDAVPFELALAHQNIPPMMAMIMMPEMIYMPEPTDVSPFIAFLVRIKF